MANLWLLTLDDVGGVVPVEEELSGEADEGDGAHREDVQAPVVPQLELHLGRQVTGGALSRLS